MFVVIVVVLVIICTANVIQAEHLIGDHVCKEEQKYTVTVEKHYKKNFTVREYVWCTNFPPRCSRYRTEERDVIKVVEEERTRVIDKCCHGYKEDVNKTYCIPECNECIHGTCIGPQTCNCTSGYTGSFCNETCPLFYWGPNCSQQCECSGHASYCNTLNGYCQCNFSWTGDKCEVSLIKKASTNILNCTEENCKTSVDNTTVSMKSSTITYKSTPEIAKFNKRVKEESASPYIAHPRMEIPEPEIKITTPFIAENIETASKKNFVAIGKTHLFSGENSEQWLKIENSDSNHHNNPILAFSISVTIGISVILILIAIILVLVIRYRKQRHLATKNKNSEIGTNFPNDSNRNRLSTQPILQRQSYQAPLPDPPIFQNPVFSVPDTNNFNNRIFYSNFEETATESTYDIPPPPCSLRSTFMPSPTPEPVYDEIPASRRPKLLPHSCCACVAHCSHSNNGGASKLPSNT